MDAFLATLPPMRAAKARAALEMQVCHNGAEFITRAALVERKVAEGARVVASKRFGNVLMHPSGAFLDARNITATGLAYATFLGNTGR